MSKKILLLFVSIFVFSLCSLAQSFNQYKKAGERAFAQGEYFAAIAYLEKAKSFNRKNDDIQNKIGKSYFELKDYENALKNFNQVRSKSEMLKVYYEIGQCFMHIGDYTNAISNFETFKNNYREDDFLATDAIQKIASCYWAKDHLVLDYNVVIESLSKNINSEFSEFASSYFKDSLLQITCFFQDEENKKNDYVSDIHFYEKNGNEWEKASFKFQTEKNKQLANGFYLEEKERFYFNQCVQTSEGRRRCDLYVSQFENNAWSTPVALNINDKKHTTTQPFVYVNDEGKDMVFYVSNKIESIGKNDIFLAEEISYGLFKTLENSNNPFNTKGDEASPYYDKEQAVLYFSSDYHYGFGGFDIFKLDFKKENAQVENLGLPYNSSANDLYYKTFGKKETHFSSNRTGAMRLRGVACCYDIFSVEKQEKQIIALIDTTTTLDSLLLVNQTDSLEKILQKIEEMLPVTVYFHNDEPNPKTTTTSTNLTYNETYEQYYTLKESYYTENNFDEIDAFFYQNLQAGFKDLKTFETLLQKLLQNNKVQLELSGYCSPLAESDYNYNLSKRRIATLENQLKQNIDLKKAIAAGKLVLVEKPFGEEKADKNISDNYFDTKKSIYSVAAALSRKVAIVGILIE